MAESRGRTCIWLLVQHEYGWTLGLGGWALLEERRRTRRRRSRGSCSIFPRVIVKFDLITNSESRDAYTKESRSWRRKGFVVIGALSCVGKSFATTRARRSFTWTILFSVR